MLLPSSSTASKIFDGASELLGALHGAGRRLAVVTTKGAAAANRALADGGCLGYFDAVIGGDMVPHMKPHPAPAQMALRRLEMSPGDSVVVGDTSHDMHMAVAANGWDGTTVPTRCGLGRTLRRLPRCCAGCGSAVR
ncbi:MAG: HAD family hydrolase [Chloroflexi bacterium]|nr:HAD family hydrolase [Chloroflexota bacterium]